MQTCLAGLFGKSPVNSFSIGASDARQALVEGVTQMANIILSGRTIRAVAREREIPCLVHFTRAANLPDILRHGIVPIADAHSFGLSPLINDQLRLDRCRDASSLSIGFPNSLMFYKYRCQKNDNDWVVLELDPAVLWSKPALFCSQNAALHTMREQSREQRASVDALRGMYAEVVGKHERQHQLLRRYDPTDVQAEVLVVDVIEPQFIQRAVFNHPAVRNRYLNPHSHLSSCIERPNCGYFAQRSWTRTVC